MPSWFWRDIRRRDGSIEKRAVVYEDKQIGLRLELTEDDLKFLLDLAKWDPLSDDGVLIGRVRRSEA